MRDKAPPARQKIRVFVVDDHPIVRRGFQLLIGMEPDMTVCGEADRGPVALERIAAAKPDVAIVDLTLNESNGLDLIKQLRIHCPQVRILIFSMRDEEVYAERALRAGANGYITKDKGPERALEGIRLLMEGKPCVSEQVSARMLERMMGGSSRTQSPDENLSDRQIEILNLIGTGLSSRQIAKRLSLSIKTVESHREHIKEKLGLRSATELVSYAFRWVRGER